MDIGQDGAGLRERKKLQTRIALSWAAIRLTVERGWDNVRVEDIAADVGVSPRTFNNYFSSKAEAIASRHLDRARLIAAELRARPASEPIWEAVVNAVTARFDMREDGDRAKDDTGALPEVSHDQWAAGLRVMLAEPAMHGEFLKAGAIAEAELAAAVAERTGTDVVRDLYPRLVAAAVGAALGVVMDHWVRTNGSAPLMSLLHDALGRISAGLPDPRTPPA
ncbi:TetR/AcrR family transcriptional regulator [Sphaerisporangium rhizosphaerae]|uniref:TetR/AcrR family transcriptional regulator n=1 Tax=Sphaerisporangium rhizosphaerae TaxID=2269375 RepID=A0ABW2PD19_9ACTN